MMSKPSRLVLVLSFVLVLSLAVGCRTFGGGQGDHGSPGTPPEAPASCH